MRVGSRDRERVLGALWLVGAALTALTIVLPYEVAIDERARGAVALLALAMGVVLIRCGPLPDWKLHASLVAGAAAIAFCTSLGVADVEGVMFLLPVGYAFAAFPPRAAVGHLVLASVAYAGVLAAASDESHVVAPVVSWVFVCSVAGTLAFAIAALSELRRRERAARRRDRRIAETLQRALLPERLPAPEGGAVAAHYRPATREADVGGDFYDAIDLGDGRLAVAIGDVAGKGLPAAAVVGRVRAAWRAYALEDPDPASVVTRLDRFLSLDSGGAEMSTMLYALADLRAGAVTWASAGHLPPLHVPAGGEPRYLTGSVGPPLGTGADMLRLVGHAALEPGDALLLYTDGLVERRDEPIDEGLERLRRAVAAGGAVEIVEAAVASVPPKPGDDAAAVALALTPVAVAVP